MRTPTRNKDLGKKVTENNAHQSQRETIHGQKNSNNLTTEIKEEIKYKKNEVNSSLQ